MHLVTPPADSTVRTFSQRLSSTRRGARLARLLAAGQLRTWPLPPSVAERAEYVVAELAANAALHGRVRGRDFRVSLTLDCATGVLLVEVTDTRGDRVPEPGPAPDPDSESGRGVFLVDALADRWGTDPCPPGGKTVWATFSPGSRPSSPPPGPPGG